MRRKMRGQQRELTIKQRAAMPGAGAEQMSRRRGAKKKGPPLKGEGPELASGPASGEHVPEKGRRKQPYRLKPRGVLKGSPISAQASPRPDAERPPAGPQPSEMSSTRASHEAARMRGF